jgi:hypothetical protein
VPNLPVDVNSWGRSACYPQSTFYPLSDDPSIRNRRITKPWFPSCSARRPHSQAGFCLYTLGAIADRAKPTFGSLRYTLGGDRPSQTTHHALSSALSELEPSPIKGGISRVAPRVLAHPLPSLPPILHMSVPDSMQSYSKGSWGLFVPLRVSGVITATTISPSSWPRQ